LNSDAEDLLLEREKADLKSRVEHYRKKYADVLKLSLAADSDVGSKRYSRSGWLGAPDFTPISAWGICGKCRAFYMFCYRKVSFYDSCW